MNRATDRPCELPRKGNAMIQPRIISVVIPVFAGCSGLHRLLRSLARQRGGLGETEIIVVQKAGAKEPPGLLRWAGILPCRRFENISVQGSGNVASLLNAGMGKAQGQWLMWLRPGDCLLPDWLEAARQAAGESSDADVIYTDSVFIGRKTSYLMRLEDDPCGLLRRVNPIGHAALIRSRLWEKIGGFTERSHRPDWEFWIRAAIRGARFVHVPRCLLGQSAASWSLPRVDEGGREKAMLVVRNHPFFDPIVVRWALALLRGDSWAKAPADDRIPDGNEVRAYQENYAQGVGMHADGFGPLPWQEGLGGDQEQAPAGAA